MNNQICEIKEHFDFSTLKLENPSLINGNNYFSKIYNNNINKNFYIQLPKCKTKQGIINSSNKCFCDLEFNSNDKVIIEFFENLENYCVKEICNNKELWFYNSDNISNDDIQDYITPIMRSYKSGKKFLIKTNIKQDKIIIYDENEKKINLEDYDNNNEFIPLLCINGIKFSKSSFVIDIILVQFMVLYPSDKFENQILIKLNKNVEKKEILQKTNCEEETNLGKTNLIENTLEENTLTENTLTENTLTENTLTENTLTENTLTENTLEENNLIENTLEEINNNQSNSTIEELDEELDEEISKKLVKNKLINDNSFKYLTNNLETLEYNNEDGSIELSNLDNIAENSEPIELKTHETIYLEIYKKAKQKAKEIRKNAIEAFLEAKNIKVKYNLNNIDDDSSSDEENEFLKNN